MDAIIKRLRKFAKDRDWEKFHTPDNLAKSIAIEASELLENFQWEDLTPEKDNIKDELADIMSYCLMMVDHYGFDLETILNEKIDKNEKKYPVGKAYGNAKKYDKL